MKLVKRLLYGAMEKCVSSYSDFEFLVAEANHLVSRRRICFRETLRDTLNEGPVPTALTPEMLVQSTWIRASVPECNSRF